MGEMKKSGRVDLGEGVKNAAAKDFWAERVSDEETLEEVRRFYKLEKYGPYVVDPHTAVGLAAQSRSAKKAPSDTTWITLATAHPAKFNSAVELALSKSSFPEFDFSKDVLPDELKALGGMKKRIFKVKGEQGVRDLIEKVKRGETAESGEAKEGLGSL